MRAVIEKLHLRRFKSFQDATLTLGSAHRPHRCERLGQEQHPDAFQFLQGIGRGYSLAEILGEKYVGGERVWSGIRGGTREVAYFGSDSFEIGFNTSLGPRAKGEPPALDYQVEVLVYSHAAETPQMRGESLMGP